MVMHAGVFQERAGLDPPRKLVVVKKVIIAPLHFAGARRARRAGDGAGHFRMAGQDLLAQASSCRRPRERK